MAEEDNFASQVEDKVEETTFKDDKDAKKIRKRAQKSKKAEKVVPTEQLNSLPENISSSTLQSDHSMTPVPNYSTHNSPSIELIQVPDGQGGFKLVRLIKRPILKPTMWFPLTSIPPWWTVQANINVLYWIIVLSAFVLRYWRIDLPKYVVFDEVHFGKFASQYLSRTFFFDVHPPLGKLIFAFIGYWNNFNGSFMFTTIGEEFPSEVPYVFMRGACALCGALLIPTVYEIMIQLGFTHRAALLACFYTLIDNSLQIQSRVIMLDAFVVLFTYLSLMCYLKVYRCRAQAYSTRWHCWLACTGTALGLLLGVKYTGLIGLGCIGLLAICDLWHIVGDLAMDKWPDPNPPLHKDLLELFVHMAYRGLYLLGIPLLMNFGLFYIHFIILSKSGPGNAFMSLPFQDTLIGENVPPPVKYSVPENSTLLRYSAEISFRNQDFSCWLHSHKDLYPLKYPDGRGSSYQQQVTCYEFKDPNNFWAIRKPGDASDSSIPNNTDPIRNKDIVELVHVSTNKLLNSHDVAAPLSPANQEIAGYINYSAKFVPYLHWRIELVDVNENIPIFWGTGKTKLKFIHVKSGQAMGCTGKRLPEWGFQQYEVATDRATEGSHTVWAMDDARHPISDIEMKEEEDMLRNSTMNQFQPASRQRPSHNVNETYSFWEKYFEMQGRMLAAHGNLGEHQFGASPIHWPLLGKTLPYWLDNKTNAQITLIGNPILWWMSTASISFFLIILFIYLMRKQRKINDIPEDVFQQYWTSGFVLLIGWSAHYLPYFLLSRVLFLHHYLPALPFKFMLFAAMCEHGFVWANKSKWYPNVIKRMYFSFIAVICSVLLISFILYAPFTFGYPALTKTQIMWLRWRPQWDLLMRN